MYQHNSWPASPHVTRAASIARTLQQKYPNTYETWFFFSFGSNVRGANGTIIALLFLSLSLSLLLI